MDATNGSVKKVEIILSPEDLVRYERVEVVFQLKKTENNSIISLLRLDERQIVEAIIDNPEVTQAKLLKVLDFSKPKLWRLIKDLENRGVIERKRHGKTYRLRCRVFNSDVD